MLQTARACPNCKSILVPTFIYMDGKETYTGLYACHVCNRIDISKEFAEEICKRLLLKELGLDG